MANATALRGGQVNSAGDVDALFLKVYGGEVLTAFDENNVFMDRHFVRNISSGKSAQFPVTWKVNASYHTVGNEIVGQTANQNEKVITIDDLLISDVFFANIDEAKAHYDYRSEYTRQTGQALAKQFDYNVARNGILAARASASVTGGYGGSTITEGTLNDFTNLGQKLADAVYDAAQALDEKDVPTEGRTAFFKPAQYYLLVQTTDVINRDWGGEGSYAAGKIPRIADIDIIKTNHLPQADDSANTAIPSAYRANFSKVKGLIMNRGAVGTVKLMDMAVESEYDIRRQGTLVVAKYAVGHGVLRPECAVELLSI